MNDVDESDGRDDALPDRPVDGDHAAFDQLGGGQSVLRRLSGLTGQWPEVFLRDVDQGAPTPMLKPLGADDPVARETGKYVIHGVLGRGGVGSVHRGHDTELGRDVAMKFLHERYRDEPAILYRFIEEAQIGGQLQHPGIVPVYDLGMADGRPFFTMKLVKGQTLAKRLSERSSPASDRRLFLSIFEDVCQTMAYAHARGVVHRDLKPANIMIGAFGEVQVVDWGMGKVLQQGGTHDEQRVAERREQRSVIETLRSSGHGTQSVMGSVMGTPAYMPPEQASGDVDHMDERSDVFALGAILCEILTGAPPYVGDPTELLGLAARAKLADAHARLSSCSADADLVELTLQCLMPAPAARPHSAEEVARTVHAHLAAAEQRAHDATVRTLAMKRTQKLGIGLTVVIAAGLAASLWFWRDAEEQRVRAENAARNEAEARVVADQRATEAARARDDAQTSLANFDRLAHVVHLQNAKESERKLFPAWPETALAMRSWLAGDAEALREALPELREAIVRMEARALPLAEEQQAEERQRSEKLANLRRELDCLKRAPEVCAGRVEPEEFALDESSASTDPVELNRLAWELAGPDRKSFGREAEGLALARRALALAKGPEMDVATMTDTLAWALLANGLHGDAGKQGLAAVALADDRNRSQLQSSLLRLREAARRAHEQEDIARVSTEIDELASEVERRRVRTFTDVRDQFLHSTLRALVADIEAFGRNEVADVERRLAWAERVEALTITRYRERWNEARLAILRADGVTASELYTEVPLELKPQIGLVPIGMNPATKLWEFYHLRSAWNPESGDPEDLEIPQHDADGNLAMDGRGIVFVLIPGGKYLLGSQSDDANAPNYDPKPSEGGVLGRWAACEVELAPYFLAKYEMTQGQWARLSGGEYPSTFKLGDKPGESSPRIGDHHPVETVSWDMCDELLEQHGLVLPTQAQWECGCRAGTHTIWFTGNDPESLEGFANIRDQSALPELPGGMPWKDGFKFLAPVGSFKPNGFGLYDTLGNVFEWCRDWLGPSTGTPRPGDGLREPGPSSGCRVRPGGSFRGPPNSARATLRTWNAPDHRSNYVGVRPAREVLP